MPPDRAAQGLTDDELMLAYARGDADAFDVLYGRHEGALLRFVRRLLGHGLSAQADEVFQDTWMRIIAARENYSARGDASWRTWAFTIAHHAAMDRLRVSGRERPLELGDDADDPMEWVQAAVDLSHPSSEDVAFWRAAGQQLLDCLDALPVAQRAAFLLHHEDGASVEDLAHRLALPFETAKSRLRYALQKLRGCMQAYLVVLEARA
ncbi:sigma-70 family RNA polymerase sigma factor [Ottowia sp. VDI28]|uniref:sigma-70 family RNA polymerase sigma factor n=1 Tax=Ottowia sp. VDI28 TaxID=3133968 RepID=UPI003C2B4E83